VIISGSRQLYCCKKKTHMSRQDDSDVSRLQKEGMAQNWHS
jgi:hypothetical protein